MSVGEAILNDALAPVPILNGFNADEGTAIYPLVRSPTFWDWLWTAGDGVRERLEPHFLEDTGRLLALYGLDDPAYSIT